MKRAIVGMSVAALLWSCSDNADKATKEPVPVVVEKDKPKPLPVVIDAAIPDARPPEVVKLGEMPHVVFKAAKTVVSPAKWTVQGVSVLISAEHTKDQGSSYTAKIVAQIGEAAATEIFACPQLVPTEGDRVELLLRGRNLHVLCIYPPHKEDLGSTDAKRLRLDLGKRALVANASYSGEGLIDPDSIDLDEGD